MAAYEQPVQYSGLSRLVFDNLVAEQRNERRLPVGVRQR
jgi:hypothetical protein